MYPTRVFILASRPLFAQGVESLLSGQPGIKVIGVGIAILVFQQLRLAFKGVKLLTGPALDPDFGEASSLGKLLFSEYVYPLEVIAILLLVAIVGALVLTGKEKA